jgi:PilZ domain
MSQERFQDVGKGRRKAPRRTFQYSAKVLGPNAIQWDGIIVDISASGAQLEFIDTRDIPDRFSLLIGGHNQVKRACQVVWRSADRLGVRFLQGEPK